MVDPFVAISRFLFDQALRLDPGRDDSRRPDWLPGTRLDALVRAVAEPSRALLQIGDQLVDARLPALPRVGERLALRVVEPYPKLVFALDDPVGTLQSKDQTRVDLSSAGRILGEVVGRRGDGARETPLRLAQTLPLPDTQGQRPQGEAIAEHLQQSLEKSGLFYEKHQARWVAGDYPLAALKLEPQARLHALLPGAGTPGPPPSGEQTGAPHAEVVSAAVANEGESLAQRPFAEARTAAEAPLRGQLELLDGRSLTVALPGWAGRDLQWELPERETQSEDGAEGPVWSTRLAVEFPSLGAVRVHLRLSGDGLALAVTSGSGESVQRLAGGQADLMQSLREAGLTLTQLTISGEHG